MPTRLRSTATAAVLAGALTLAGCSAGTTPDPALVAEAASALSSSRTAELGLSLQSSDRMFPGTATALYSDMEDALAQSVQTLEVASTTTAEDVAFRDRTLAAARAAIEGVRDAQDGDRASAQRALHQASDELAQLAETP